MPFWLWGVVVLLGLVALSAILGLVKSVMRLALAAISAVVVTGAVYVIAEVLLPDSLGIVIQIPEPVYLLLGAMCMLSILIRR